MVIVPPDPYPTEYRCNSDEFSPTVRRIPFITRIGIGPEGSDMEVVKIRLPNADYVADLLRAVTAVIEEGTFRATQDGMRLVAMDPAHISLVDFELRADAAEEFKVVKDTEITINVEELVKLLRRAKKTDALILSYDDELRRLNITLSDLRGGKERVFTLNTLEPMGGTMNPPSLSFDATARLEAESFHEAIEDSKAIADSVKITIKPEMVVVTAKGETKSAQHRFVTGGPAVREIDAKSEASASFSIVYLEKIVKPGKALSEDVEIRLSTNRPIKLSFPINFGRLEYLVAPRMD
jgi:proliferating cell nuclear antigen